MRHRVQLLTDRQTERAVPNTPHGCTTVLTPTTDCVWCRAYTTETPYTCIVLYRTADVCTARATSTGNSVCCLDGVEPASAVVFAIELIAHHLLVSSSPRAPQPRHSGTGVSFSTCMNEHGSRLSF